MSPNTPTKPSTLETALSQKLNIRRTTSTIRRLTTTSPSDIDFSSNDFLSLASNPDLRRKFIHELDKSPAHHQTGSGGSRLLDGNSTYALDLEKQIATFHAAEAGLLCNSGFDANVGLFSCLPQEGDVIIYDEAIHASVHDGMKLSRARECLPFLHNDVQSLDKVIQQCLDNSAGLRTGKCNVFVAVETVYSMDGDLAPLRQIADLLKHLLPQGNAHLIVDEAHSTGLYGPCGRGLVAELGLEHEITVRLHTFGKALACNGAVLLCSPTIREYLINYARPLIYTTFMSYPSLAAVKASYDFLAAGRTEALAEDLGRLIREFHRQLLELQEELTAASCDSRSHAAVKALIRVPRKRPKSPIFAVLTSEPQVLAAYCQAQGFTVRGIVPPTVATGTERVRVCLHAGNTLAQVEGLVQVLRSWVEMRRATLLRESADSALESPRARL
ncbi:hypothetical protein LTR62_002546 [Meristemomyces frigidus]|uniref:Aminotransferase class I/classII large domain-containing protein n=1 Tax=Meristemomyces frigidus TaxID=1508187 RepID=A0AAN7TJE4_9PEZI|nr:hypothetical protein LTR62_002546 [Meristemomyces frigidus]